jgi:hypothetical protein
MYTRMDKVRTELLMFSDHKRNRVERREGKAVPAILSKLNTSSWRGQ